jgi:CBS-domain-containing membrane protein
MSRPQELVKDLMTQNVKTVSTNDLMTEVMEVFEKNNFHHLPVIDEDQKLKGIISRFDCNKMLTTMSIFDTERSRRENEEWASKLLTEDVMTEDVVTLRAEDDLIKAIVLLQKNQYHAFPVVNDEQRVIGILTTYDLINYAFSAYNIPKNTGYVPK